MLSAAKNLTPITLELGGKSPCIVDETANTDLSAKRIAWGKFLNAGQTCVAPDYILVHESKKDALISGLKKYITKFYGAEPLSNPELPKIINAKHFERLTGLMQSGTTAVGGGSNAEKQIIEPTVLTDISPLDPIMREEVFGPVLPILTFKKIEEVIAFTSSRPKPLALYLFTSDKANEKFILNAVSFGGGCVNDAVMHIASSKMPFGGVGESGMGGYHGEFGFSAFTHLKSVLKKSRRIDVPLRYPPYKNKLKWLKKFFK
jgi:aldehyde dehydrogenase (NAD+)